MFRGRYAVSSAWRILGPSKQARLTTRIENLNISNIRARYSVQHNKAHRVSKFFAPTQGLKKGTISAVNPHDVDIGTELLVRGGFIRQAYSGIWHLLPLGLRVQDKIEALIDKHMQGGLGASKLSLSTITSEALWRESGRYQAGRDSEFFNFIDRKGSKFLLSPTHEEEITKIVRGAVASYEDLPVRLYQITRKYRDEARPRHGLLRGREFVMKDLYTFDASEAAALSTYEDVRDAYQAFFHDVGLPYLVASADNGNMGGSLSHEYHFPSASGEDMVASCTSCDYCANEEVHHGHFHQEQWPKELHAQAATGISKDRSTLYAFHFPADGELRRSAQTQESLNMHILKKLLPDLDPTVEDAEHKWREHHSLQPDEPPTICSVIDPRVSVEGLGEDSISDDMLKRLYSSGVPQKSLTLSIDGQPVLLTAPKAGDPCPKCESGQLKVDRTIEIAHTFHLSDRYSKPLKAQITTAQNEGANIEMGCHGIGVSRLIGAVASQLADSKGLQWPVSIAPFSTVVLLYPNLDGLAEAEQLCSTLQSQQTLDAIIDDRSKSLPWKLNDADVVGYPFIVVFGRSWLEKREVELQCRSLGVKEQVPLGKVADRILELTL